MKKRKIKYNLHLYLGQKRVYDICFFYNDETIGRDFEACSLDNLKKQVIKFFSWWYCDDDDDYYLERSIEFAIIHSGGSYLKKTISTYCDQCKKYKYSKIKMNPEKFLESILKNNKYRLIMGLKTIREETIDRFKLDKDVSESYIKIFKRQASKTSEEKQYQTLSCISPFGIDKENKQNFLFGYCKRGICKECKFNPYKNKDVSIVSSLIDCKNRIYQYI